MNHLLLNSGLQKIESKEARVAAKAERRRRDGERDGGGGRGRKKKRKSKRKDNGSKQRVCVKARDAHFKPDLSLCSVCLCTPPTLEILILILGDQSTRSCSAVALE